MKEKRVAHEGRINKNGIMKRRKKKRKKERKKKRKKMNKTNGIMTWVPLWWLTWIRWAKPLNHKGFILTKQ